MMSQNSSDSDNEITLAQFLEEISDEEEPIMIINCNCKHRSDISYDLKKSVSSSLKTLGSSLMDFFKIAIDKVDQVTKSMNSDY